MPATLLPLVLVAFLGVAVAVVLFPTEEERALMYLKDKEFSEALDVYEKMVQKGRLMMFSSHWNTFPTLRGTWAFYLNHVLPPRPSKSYRVVGWVGGWPVRF